MQEIIRSKSHQKHVASQPCFYTGATEGIQCCHVKFLGERFMMGKRVSDIWTIPMHYLLHEQQHQHNELEWHLQRLMISPIAKKYWATSPDKKIREFYEQRKIYFTS
tara:strand:+ start:25423 stop:25743 length:321 start_codon:yes stop_codon:yes gene_type:complete